MRTFIFTVLTLVFNCFPLIFSMLFNDTDSSFKRVVLNMIPLMVDESYGNFFMVL